MQGSEKHRIPDPDQQHCSIYHFVLGFDRGKTIFVTCGDWDLGKLQSFDKKYGTVVRVVGKIIR
jgi:hypothetical protein